MATDNEKFWIPTSLLSLYSHKFAFVSFHFLPSDYGICRTARLCSFSICHSLLFSIFLSLCVNVCSVHTCMFFACVWVHVWGGVEARVYMWMWRTKCEARKYLSSFSHLILWTKISQSKPELADMARFASQLVKGISCFSFLRLELQTSCHASPRIYRGSGDWDSCPRVCMASNLTLESTPQSAV